MVRAVIAGRKTQTRRLSPQWDRLRVGDRLWVLETWCQSMECGEFVDGKMYYAADGTYVTARDGDGSRITLEVTAPVRVERLQMLDRDDALAEGAAPSAWGPRHMFHTLWDQLHNKPGERWADNPLVRVISFKLLEVRR